IQFAVVGPPVRHILRAAGGRRGRRDRVADFSRSERTAARSFADAAVSQRPERKKPGGTIVPRPAFDVCADLSASRRKPRSAEGSEAEFPATKAADSVPWLNPFVLVSG